MLRRGPRCYAHVTSVRAFGPGSVRSPALNSPWPSHNRTTSAPGAANPASPAFSRSLFALPHPCARRSPLLRSCQSSTRYPAMATLTARRTQSTQAKGKERERVEPTGANSHSHDHHEANHSHSHSHSHDGGFLSSLVHRHSHGEEENAKSAESMVQALKGGGESLASDIPQTHSSLCLLRVLLQWPRSGWLSEPSKFQLVH